MKNLFKSRKQTIQEDKKDVQYDENGILSLENGAKIFSIKRSNNQSLSLYEITSLLGYDSAQVYWPSRTYSDNEIVAMMFKIISCDLVCIVRNDEKIMSKKEILTAVNEGFIKQQNWELEDCLDEGIKNQTLTKLYFEEILHSKVIDNVIKGDDYEYTFQNGFLVNYSSIDGFSSDVKDYLSTELDTYIIEAESFYVDNDSIISEINFHAYCYTSIPIDILQGIDGVAEFAYPTGIINYIALFAYHDIENIEMDVFLKSTQEKL